MKIVLDGRTIRPRRTGVGHYTECLLRSLMAIDRENEYVVLFNDTMLWDHWDKPENFRSLRVTADYEKHPQGDLWERFGLPRLLEREKADLFHGPAFRVPHGGAPCPTVVTIHDLTCWRCAADHPWKFRYYLRWVTRKSVAAASAIISVSNATAADLREILSVPDTKIHVIHEAADERYRPAPFPDREQLLAIHPALGRPYILAVGTIEPRKRIDLLVEAYARLRNRTSFRHSLILVGQVGWKAKASLRAMRESPVADSIYHLDYLAEDDLIDIYHGADLFVMASRYEGFGLPPLEAMACGVPVVVTQGGSLGEVVGDGGVIVKDSRPDALANALMTVLSDRAIQASLRERSLKREAEFSWQETARQTLAVYEKVAGVER